MTMKRSESSPTIYDVAKLANVSPGTVSRYINGIGVPRAATKEKLDTAISTLHYVPNRVAQALKKKRSQILCMNTPKSSNPLYFQLFRTMEEYARRAGYTLISLETDDSPEYSLQTLSFLCEGITDGLILFNIDLTAHHMESFYQLSCPLVICSTCVSPYGGNDLDNFDYVGFDIRSAAYQMATHMLRQSHRRLALLCGPTDRVVYKESYEGFSSALIANGLPADSVGYYYASATEDDGFAMGEQIVSLPADTRPTAVCVTDDIVAYGLMRAFRQAGLRIPQDIAVFGMGDLPYDKNIAPSLSSVCFSEDEICRCAVNFLVSRISGDNTNAKKIIFQPSLIIRESSEYSRAEE